MATSSCNCLLKDWGVAVIVLHSDFQKVIWEGHWKQLVLKYLMLRILPQITVLMIFLIHQCSLEDPTTVPVSKQVVVDWDPNPEHDGWGIFELARVARLFFITRVCSKYMWTVEKPVVFVWLWDCACSKPLANKHGISSGRGNFANVPHIQIKIKLKIPGG